MANLTIYLPDDVERKLRTTADESHMSLSKGVAERISKSLETSWSAEFLALAGAFPDFPEGDELLEGYGGGVPRETVE